MSAVLLRSAITDITPSQPCLLAGYDNRPFPASSVAGKLEAHILQLEHNGKQMVFISLDTFLASREFKLGVIEKFNALHEKKLKEEEILLIASHTHFAPTLDPGKPVLGKSDEKYIDAVSEKISSALLEMQSKNPEKVFIRLHEIKTRHTMNRRSMALFRKGFRIIKKMTIGPNRSGKTCDKINVLHFSDESGGTKALAWHFACHPTNFYLYNSVHPDFIGTVRNMLKKKYGSIPVVFLQGFAGNIKPYVKNKKKSFAEKIRELFMLSLSFVSFDEKMFTGWAESLGAEALKAIEDTPVLQVIPALKCKLIEKNLHYFFRRTDHITGNITFQEMQLGEQLSIVSVSAEPVIEYEEAIQQVYGKTKVLCCGYTDSVYIYLPTSRQVKEGGYECEGFREKFSITGNFNPAIEKNVTEAFRTLKEKTGEK